MFGVGSAGWASATANPLFMLPVVAGEAAQFASQRMSRRQVGLLDELVRNGAPLTPKAMLDYERAATAGLLSSQAPNQE